MSPKARTGTAPAAPRRAGGATALRGASTAFGVTGALAALGLVAAEALGLRPWVLFLAWVGLGLLGATWAAGGRLLAGFVLRAAAGMATVALAGALDAWLGAAALPLALGCSCGTLAMLERFPPLNQAPAYFLGMIAYFGSGDAPSGQLLLSLSGAATLGVMWAWAAQGASAAIERRRS